MDSKKGCGLGGIIAIIILVVLFIVLKEYLLFILIAIGVIIAAFVILLLVLNKKDKAKAEEKELLNGNISERITAYRKLVSELMHFYYNIHDKEVKLILRKIEKAALKMIDVIKADPRDADKAGRFMRTSLDGAKRIMDSFRRLEKAPESSENVAKAKADAVSSLNRIIDAFEHQTKKLYDNDVMNMDVETEVLNKTLDEQWPKEKTEEE